MSMNKKKLLSKANGVSDALDELEAKLEPLLSQKLPDVEAPLSTLQRSKLNVLLAYLVNDLIFIYLRLKGLDPKEHPVIAELERVRQYFAKIKKAEDSGEKRTSTIDKAAANRFIKHAISQAIQDSKATNAESGPSQPSTFVPGRVTDKMLERERYQQNLKDASSDSEEGVEIIDDVKQTVEDSDIVPSEVKGKRKEEAPSAAVESDLGVQSNVHLSKSSKSSKRKRPMDPFGPSGVETPKNEPVPKKSKDIVSIVDNELSAPSRASSASAAAESDVLKTEGKKRKRKRKKRSLANQVVP